MRTKHTPHSLPAFPVYSAAFIANDRLVLGGGGGTGRSGIKNKIRLCNVPNDRTVEIIDEYELDVDEDAPMSMASSVLDSTVICGINSAKEQLDQGRNENCRLFDVRKDHLKLETTASTLQVGRDNPEEYQKVTEMSPDGSLVVAAGSKDFTILSYPLLTPTTQSVHTEHEIYDATFSSVTVVIATTHNLLVYDLPPSSGHRSPMDRKGKKKQKPVRDLKVIKVIDQPSLPVSRNSTSTFRAARFLPGDDQTLYTVLNVVSPRTRGKPSPKRGFVCKWNVNTWKVVKVRQVGKRGVTCFDVSPNGRWLACGSADYTISLLDAQTLVPLLTILRAHEFPPTTLKFNPASRLLVSGSADNTIRVVTIPENIGASSAWGTVSIVLSALLVLVLAILSAYQARSGRL